jgi:hypothetical protein
MSRKVVWDASDEAQVAAVEAQEKDRERDLQWILSSDRGRRWIYSLCYENCHVDAPSFCGDDTHGTAFNEGGRAIGAALLETVRNKHFSAFIKMIEENYGTAS